MWKDVDFAKMLDVTRQAASSYLKTKKFSNSTLKKIIKVLKIDSSIFFDDYATIKSNIVSEPQSGYGNNYELLKIYREQLDIVNNLLKKALENESKALDLLTQNRIDINTKMISK